MEKYDAFLFGNGLTLNLLNQLKEYVPVEKRYLLNLDDFLNAYINNNLNSNEVKTMNALYYEKTRSDKLHYNKILKKQLNIYYQSEKNYNIEYWFGIMLFEKKIEKLDYDAIMSAFPFLYNLWHNLLLEYLEYLQLNNLIINFNQSLIAILNNPTKIYTTNFDGLFDFIHPKHIHGSFVKNFKQPIDLVLKFEGDKIVHYKTVWGFNGEGKYNSLSEYYKEKHDRYFDFEFLFSEDIKINHLLIYGISFQPAGYLDLLKNTKQTHLIKYKNSYIDDHILKRMNYLQNTNRLNSITFAYFDEKDKIRYKHLAKIFGLKNVSYILSSEFKFTIK